MPLQPKLADKKDASKLANIPIGFDSSLNYTLNSAAPEVLSSWLLNILFTHIIYKPPAGLPQVLTHQFGNFEH